MEQVVRQQRKCLGCPPQRSLPGVRCRPHNGNGPSDGANGPDLWLCLCRPQVRGWRPSEHLYSRDVLQILVESLKLWSRLEPR